MSYVANPAEGIPAAHGGMRRRFGSGVKPEPGLTVGVFPAYMADFDDAATYETVEGKYGESIKIRYGVLVMSRVHGTRMYEINELCADSASVRSKLVSRAAAVTPGVEITDETDLGTLNTEGWCLVELENDPKPNDKGAQYLRIKNVMQLPAGMAERLPEVVTGWDSKQGRVFVRLAQPGDQRTLDGGFDGRPEPDHALPEDEPPF